MRWGATPIAYRGGLWRATGRRARRREGCLSAYSFHVCRLDEVVCEGEGASKASLGSAWRWVRMPTTSAWLVIHRASRSAAAALASRLQVGDNFIPACATTSFKRHNSSASPRRPGLPGLLVPQPTAKPWRSNRQEPKRASAPPRPPSPLTLTRDQSYPQCTSIEVPQCRTDRQPSKQMDRA